jgi:hypothetical protein
VGCSDQAVTGSPRRAVVIVVVVITGDTAEEDPASPVATADETCRTPHSPRARPGRPPSITGHPLGRQSWHVRE